jgi:hypothetical protein
MPNGPRRPGRDCCRSPAKGSWRRRFADGELVAFCLSAAPLRTIASAMSASGPQRNAMDSPTWARSCPSCHPRAYCRFAPEPDLGGPKLRVRERLNRHTVSDRGKRPCPAHRVRCWRIIVPSDLLKGRVLPGFTGSSGERRGDGRVRAPPGGARNSPVRHGWPPRPRSRERHGFRRGLLPERRQSRDHPSPGAPSNPAGRRRGHPRLSARQ